MKPKKRKPKKIELVPIDSIKSGPIVHRAFPEAVLTHLKSLWERIKTYAPYETLEQMEVGFMRDPKPLGEIAIWEKIADAVEACEKELGFHTDISYPTVMEYSLGAVKPADRAMSPTKEIVAVCKRVGLIPSPLQITRR